jgi:hypothetical protein
MLSIYPFFILFHQGTVSIKYLTIKKQEQIGNFIYFFVDFLLKQVFSDDIDLRYFNCLCLSTM